jgi:hypothetical protein
MPVRRCRPTPLPNTSPYLRTLRGDYFVPIEVRCEHCGKTMQVQDSSAGTRGRCPFCKEVIQVPPLTSVVRAKPVSKVPSPSAQLPVSPVIVDASPISSPKSSGGEETIYSDPDVVVTTSRILCSGATYALRNITSVKMGETPHIPGCALFLMFTSLPV